MQGITAGAVFSVTMVTAFSSISLIQYGADGIFHELIATV